VRRGPEIKRKRERKTMDINSMYRELSDEAKARFREWARNNHKAGDEINSLWHPIVKDECRLIDKEKK